MPPAGVRSCLWGGAPALVVLGRGRAGERRRETVAAAFHLILLLWF